MATQTRARLTPDEYLAAERRAETKSEYLDGEVFAMTGASRRHGLVAIAVAASLHQQLRGRPCEAFASDMRVRIPSTNAYLYPDVVVVCGEPRFEDAELDTLLDPTLIVEVPSRSTQDYDRGTKFAHYRRIESLREYVLFAQDRVYVEHHARQPDGRWLMAEITAPDAVLDLRSIECSLALAEAYAKVTFGAI